MTSGEIPGSPIGSTDLVERLLRTAHQYRRAQFGTLGPLGLTPAQERTLRMIARADGPIRMGAIAERMGVVPRSVTPLVDALEEAGLVQRTIDPASRRSILLTLTESGRAVQDRLIEVRRAAGDKLFATLTGDERDELARLLDKVAAQLVPPDKCNQETR